MTKLVLPDVTLVAIDTVAHDLTRLALVDSLKQIDPAEVLVYSNRPLLPGTEWIDCWPTTFDDVSRITWVDIPKRVKTSHFLLIQWDGWVLDSNLWNPEWLETDYIGALWWYKDRLNVGNGGFTLRSAALGKFVAACGIIPPHPEDDWICRNQRPRLEKAGFTWATPTEAAKFSFERQAPHSTFGFHGMFNWPDVLPQAALRERISLANDYVHKKVEWQELMTRTLNYVN